MKNIIISRTDNLGDVVLSLPIAGKLKKTYPDAKIIFLGKAYTMPVIISSGFVDECWEIENLNNIKAENFDAIIFLYPDKEVAEWAKKNKIKIRIGTSHRWWHWLYCNRLVNFSRKKSNLHEAQLNFKLLGPLGLPTEIGLDEIKYLYGMKAQGNEIPELLKNSLVSNKIKIILHPKSKGSAREWPMENYLKLADNLSPDKYQIFITGSQPEGNLMQTECPELFLLPHVHILAGKLSLGELVNFIGVCDALVACSTGPLHIAAALGKKAIGIYPNLKPMHAGRWGPIGHQAKVLHINKPDCHDCLSKPTGCDCIKQVPVKLILEIIEN